jgi:hypothetical protein
MKWLALPRRVVFPTVSPSVAHVFDLGFVEVGELVLLFLRAEAQGVHQLQRIPQAVATLKLVFDLPEDLPDLVFDRVGIGRALFESLKVGKEFLVYMINKVVTCERCIMIEGAIRFLWCSPTRLSV